MGGPLSHEQWGHLARCLRVSQDHVLLRTYCYSESSPSIQLKRPAQPDVRGGPGKQNKTCQCDLTPSGVFVTILVQRNLSWNKWRITTSGDWEGNHCAPQGTRLQGRKNNFPCILLGSQLGPPAPVAKDRLTRVKETRLLTYLTCTGEYPGKMSNSQTWIRTQA